MKEKFTVTESLPQIRLELTPDTPLDDIIKFAELAKRYGHRQQTEIAQPTEGNRERTMLVFNIMPGKVEPEPAKRVEYVEPEDRLRRRNDLSKQQKQSIMHHTHRYR